MVFNMAYFKSLPVVGPMHAQEEHQEEDSSDRQNNSNYEYNTEKQQHERKNYRYDETADTVNTTTTTTTTTPTTTSISLQSALVRQAAVSSRMKTRRRAGDGIASVSTHSSGTKHSASSHSVASTGSVWTLDWLKNKLKFDREVVLVIDNAAGHGPRKDNSRWGTRSEHNDAAPRRSAAETLQMNEPRRHILCRWSSSTSSTGELDSHHINSTSSGSRPQSNGNALEASPSQDSKEGKKEVLFPRMPCRTSSLRNLLAAEQIADETSESVHTPSTASSSASFTPRLPLRKSSSLDLSIASVEETSTRKVSPPERQTAQHDDSALMSAASLSSWTKQGQGRVSDALKESTVMPKLPLRRSSLDGCDIAAIRGASPSTSSPTRPKRVSSSQQRKGFQRQLSLPTKQKQRSRSRKKIQEEEEIWF